MSYHTFSWEVHGLFLDGVGGVRNGQDTLEDRLRTQVFLPQQLVHRDVIEAVSLGRQGCRHASVI